MADNLQDRFTINSKMLSSITTFLMLLFLPTASNADGLLNSPIWKREISNVYICSSSPKLNAGTFRDYNLERKILTDGIGFHDKWSAYTNNKSGAILVISVSSKPFDKTVKECLSKIPVLLRGWINEIDKQAKTIGTLPDYLANSQLGDAYETVKLSWRFMYSDRVILSSLVYLSDEYLSQRDAQEGAFQIDHENCKKEGKNNGK